MMGFLVTLGGVHGFLSVGMCTNHVDFHVIHNLKYKNTMVSKIIMRVNGKTAYILLPGLEAVCTWLTSWVMVSGSTRAVLRSGGSCVIEFNCFVFDRSRLLGGPSTWLGVIVATVVSVVFSTGSGCLPSSCWSVFHPKSGRRPCGIRFLAVLP